MSTKQKGSMEPLGRICHPCGKLLSHRPPEVFTSLLTECSICGETAYCGAASDYGFPDEADRERVRILRRGQADGH